MKSRKLVPFLIVLILATIPVTLASPALSIIVATSKKYYQPEESIHIYGNLTSDGSLVEGLVALQVDDPNNDTVVLRGLQTGADFQTGPIEILNVFPGDFSGNPKDSFEAGTWAYFYVTVNYTASNKNWVLLAVNVFDASNVTLGIGSKISFLGPGPRLYRAQIPFEIPLWGFAGSATVYATAFNTTLPKNGGALYCSELSETFEITGGTQGLALEEAQDQSNKGNYNLTFKLSSEEMLGTYTAHVSSKYGVQIATNNTTFTLTPALSITVATSKKYFLRGEGIDVYGNLTSDGSPVEGVLVGLQVIDPNGQPVVVTTPITGAGGNYSYTFKLSTGEPLGTYIVYVSSSYEEQQAMDSTTFTLYLPTISVYPQTISKAIGETFTIDIIIPLVVNLWGWQAGMTFNPAVLEAISFVEGPLLKYEGRTTLWVPGTINNLAGEITYYGCTLTAGCTPVTGSGTLASVTFRVKDYGTSDLTLTDVKLIDPTYTSFPQVTVLHGSFTLSPPPPAPPFANFTYTPPTPQVGDAITFNASASYDPDGTIVSYDWDFGDGSITTVAVPIITHIYAVAGAYSVTLTVTDDDGLSNMAWQVLSALANPVASFFESPESPTVGQEVTFVSNSTDVDGYIVSWLWDFGDGSSGIGEIVTHTYATAGVYSVTLTVIDNDSLQHTYSKEITVQEASTTPPGVPLYVLVAAVITILILATLAVYLISVKKPKP